MNSGCTGRVGRLEVTTFTQDALKTTNANAAAAHDLVIEGGWASFPPVRREHIRTGGRRWAVLG